MRRPDIKRAMILAAGLGTRLLPITEKFPKPLVPVLNVPNILHALYLLKRSGIERVIINLHHLSDLLENYLGDGSRWGMHIAFSKEKALLGTGGGLKKAEGFFEGEPLVLVNCDFISDVDLRPLLEKHLERNAIATMLLHRDPEQEPFYAKVGVDSHSRLVSLPRRQISEPSMTGIFTGIHILSQETFRYLQEIPSGINEVLYPALMGDAPDKIYGEFIRDAYWYDTGERNTLWLATLRLMEKLERGDKVLETFLETFGGFAQMKPGVWVAEGASLPAGATLRAPVVIGKHCLIEEKATVGPYAVLGDDCTVGKGATVSSFVGLGAARIPAGSRSEDALQFQQLTLPAKRAR